MGSARAGRRAATSRDVAALAGVAQSTVSMVINGGSASEATRVRVEQAMRKLGYQPNAGARTLRTSKSRVIALVVHLERQDDPTETVPYIDGMVGYARARDYDVILSPFREGPESLSRLAGRGISDGFVLMDVETEDERVPVVERLGMPTVLVGRPLDSRGLDVVDLDMRRAGELLVDELVETGHREIVMLAEPDEVAARYRFMQEFGVGVRARAERHGLTLETVARDAQGMAAVGASADRLTTVAGARRGIIAGTSRDTQWIMNVLQLNDLVPGRDISVVSRCTDDVAEGFAWPVTNVSPQPRQVSEVAMSMLFDRMAGAGGPGREELIAPGPVCRRATTTDFVG